MIWNRRTFLALLPASPLLPASRCRHIPAHTTSSSEPPAAKRVPFGWRAAAVGEGLTFRFPAPGSRLRVCVAVDSRESKKLEVRAARSGARIGEFDMRFAHALELFELPLDAATSRIVAKEGITLRLTEGESPAWIISQGAPSLLLPHVLQIGAAKPIDEYHRRLEGIAAVQPFGWMEGCLLDGLASLGREDALAKHLALFVPEPVRLVYEDARSQPSDGRIASVEETLPFAHIALRHPAHPAIDAAIAYWRAHRDAEGCIVDGGMTSAEGSYTVAYPLARVARVRRDRELEDLAVLQLRLRQRRLIRPEGLFLRNHRDRGLTYRSWARGVAWYMLGLAHTLNVLRDRMDLQDLRAETTRVAEWALQRQSSAALWSCYLDDAPTGPETSGSAGIAAALAMAARLGLANENARMAATRTQRALESYLTPDGLLSGAAQSNRGGEELQRSGYRVISQMGMGLMAQLIGALRSRRPT